MCPSIPKPVVQAEPERVLDNLTTVILLFDDRQCLSYINPAGEMLFAVSARHVTGLPIDQLIQCPASTVQTVVDRALRIGQPFTEREMHLLLNGANAVTVDCTVTPLEDPEHGLEILIEIQQVDRQLRISREEHLLSQQQATRQVVRGMAHEIKNPLGGLRGAAQLLERELPDLALAEYTRIIIDEADRLQSLVDRMLGPNRPAQKSPVNLHQVLERVRTLVLADYCNQPLRLQRDYDPSLPELCGDSDQLIQALLNIVSNAAQAMDGRGTITMRSRVHRQFTIANRRFRLTARIDVIDDGPGIPEDLKAKLFFPLVTGRADGTGLGLSIAQTLVNQHGGLIECASQPGRTIFTILLPLEKDPHES